MNKNKKRLVWDEIGERFYETGVEKAVLFPTKADGAYDDGVAWNGLTKVTESPSGGEPTALYANDSKYLEIMSNEEFGATIEAYTYPDEWSACDGSVEVAPGVYAGQQSRKRFGFAYKTLIGNDVDGTDHGYKLHLVYGGLAKPSSKDNSTINDSPEPSTMSWEVSTTPVKVSTKIDGKTLKPVSHFVFDSTRISEEKMAALEEILYGKDPSSESADDGVAARLPLPDEVITLMTPAAG